MGNMRVTKPVQDNNVFTRKMYSDIIKGFKKRYEAVIKDYVSQNKPELKMVIPLEQLLDENTRVMSSDNTSKAKSPPPLCWPTSNGTAATKTQEIKPNDSLVFSSDSLVV